MTDPTTPARSTRLRWGVAALVSGAILLLSVAAMARRVAAYHEQTPRPLPQFQVIDQREFDVHGRPVAITDAADASGNVAVRIRYGDQTLRLPATMESKSAQMPGLTRHADWLLVLQFVEQGRLTPAELEARLARGEAGARVVIVVLDPRRDLDGTAHGRGRPSDWLFDFHELRPDGSIRSERYGWPLRKGQQPPVAGVQPLPDDTWQYYAGLMVVPRSSKPTPTFTQDAVRAMGWTLPVAAFSGLICVWSTVAAFARARRD